MPYHSRSVKKQKYIPKKVPNNCKGAAKISFDKKREKLNVVEKVVEMEPLLKPPSSSVALEMFERYKNFISSKPEEIFNDPHSIHYCDDIEKRHPFFPHIYKLSVDLTRKNYVLHKMELRFINPQKGLGVVAGELINQFEILMPYFGDCVPAFFTDFEREEEEDKERFYIMTTSRFSFDGRYFLNYSVFLNHCCGCNKNPNAPKAPNAIVMEDEDGFPWLFALTAIKPGEEIVWYYAAGETKEGGKLGKCDDCGEVHDENWVPDVMRGLKTLILKYDEEERVCGCEFGLNKKFKIGNFNFKYKKVFSI
jgi:hypothetical protein